MASTQIWIINIAYGGLVSMFTSLSIWIIYLLHVDEYLSFHFYVVTLLLKCLLVLALVTCIVLSVVCIHIISMSKSESHTVATVGLHYLMYIVNTLAAYPIKRSLQTSWRQPRIMQEQLLQDILQKNKATEYGKRYTFSTISNLSELRKRHPLTRYPHYEEYVERMARGEDNVLMSAKPTRFALTSGTTGHPKVLPVTSELERSIYNMMAVLKDMVLQDTFPRFGPLEKVVRLYWEPTQRTTPANHTLGPLSKLNEKYKRLVSITSTSPTPAFSIRDVEACTYVHSLFALKERSVGLFMTSFTTSLYAMMKHLENNWMEMVNDIANGTILSNLNLPDDIRFELQKCIRPDPVRADEVRREFQRGFDGILARLWPSCIAVTSSDAAGIKTNLKQTYCKGLPVYGTTYTASEGLLGVNLWPNREGPTDRFVLLPDANVMEFIPADNMDEEQPTTLFIDELEVSQDYEMVLTLSSGLCRLRFGDVIKVVDYYGNCPVIEFQYRSGQMLNVCGEKVDQALVSSIMKDVTKSWGNEDLVDYACAESNLLLKGGEDAGAKPYYMFFIELEGNNVDHRLSKLNLDLVEKLLCDKSFTYNSFREKDMVLPAKIHLVKPGTFKLLQDYLITNTSASMNQFKNHRKLQTWDCLDLMLKNVVYDPV